MFSLLHVHSASFNKVIRAATEIYYRREEHTGWRNKNGATDHPISLQIFPKVYDRIAWKLVNFC